MINRDQLVAVMPHVGAAADQLTDDLNTAMDRFEIDTPPRVAAFLAQVAHESGELQHWTENLNYGWQSLRKVFAKYFPTDALAQAFDRQPERIANRVYAGRMGNGPEASGDGWRYRGHGPIQLTGKDNYRACGTALGRDLVGQPELVGEPEVGCLAAAWFWTSKGLNALADSGDFEGITRRINGGLIGLAERRAFWERAKAALAEAPVPLSHGMALRTGAGGSAPSRRRSAPRKKAAARPRKPVAPKPARSSRAPKKRRSPAKARRAGSPGSRRRSTPKPAASARQSRKRARRRTPQASDS